MTEGGASKKEKETEHSGEYKPPKKRKNKTKKNQKKEPKPKSTQSLKHFFSCILFCKDMSVLKQTNKQTNKQHPPQVQCNFPT
jgi:Pyruvate/2-oxoacid:ferredoxin oxidoreductase delta subunit